MPEVRLRILRLSWQSRFGVQSLTYANISNGNGRARQGDEAIPLLHDCVPCDWTTSSAGKSPPDIPSIRCSNDGVLLCVVFFSSRGSTEEHARFGTHDGNCENYCRGRDDRMDIWLPQVAKISIFTLIFLMQNTK